MVFVQAMALAGLVLLAGGGLTGCAGKGGPVQTAYDESADFTRYRTFEVEAVSTDRMYGFINAMVQDALIRNLLAKGLDPALETEPDLRVRFATEVDNVTGVDIEYVPTEQGIWTRYFADPEMAGRLLVNLVDVETGRVVWKGVTSGPVDMSQDVEQEQVNRAVDELLAEFPPGIARREH